MGKKRQRDEENAIMTQISSIFPTFLGGMPFVSAIADPPDFIAECVGGQRVGLELTSWLNCDQASAAQGRERMREDLLKIIEWKEYPRPHNVRALIMPRWGKPIRDAHRQSFSSEFLAAVQSIDDNWKALRGRHWRKLDDSQPFDYEMHDLASFPTLGKYVASIFFFELTEFSVEQSWVSVSTVDDNHGLYDPVWSIQALRKAVRSKVERYSGETMKARLCLHDLHKLYLLVYADSERFSSNTLFQTPVN